jgi:hypothetical protein
VAVDDNSGTGVDWEYVLLLLIIGGIEVSIPEVVALEEDKVLEVVRE